MQHFKQTILEKLLKKIRKEANLKQVDLAIKLNKPQSYVSKYESSEKILNLIELHDVCLALNIKLIDFIKRYENDLTNDSK